MKRLGLGLLWAVDMTVRSFGIVGIALWTLFWVLVIAAIKISWSLFLGLCEAVLIMLAVVFWKRHN